MPGRPNSMARKATALEAAVLEVFRQADAVTPEIHKETKHRHGVSAPTSPWVAVYRLCCELVLAVDELGSQCREDAGDFEPGPVRQEMSDMDLDRMRDRYQRDLRGRTQEEIARCYAGRAKAGEKLPMTADIRDEVTWVTTRLFEPVPDFETAPSQAAISLWFTLETKVPGHAAEFMMWVVRQRLPPGDRPVHTTPVAREDPRADEETDEELQERLAPPIWAEPGRPVP